MKTADDRTQNIPIPPDGFLSLFCDKEFDCFALQLKTSFHFP